MGKKQKNENHVIEKKTTVEENIENYLNYGFARIGHFKLEDLDPDSSIYKKLKKSIISVIVSIYAEKLVIFELPKLYKILEDDLKSYKEKMDREVAERDYNRKNQLNLFEQDLFKEEEKAGK